MSKRLPTPLPLWDELFPLLIARWRKLMKLPAGPIDRLQTREFRSLIEHLQNYKKEKDLSSVESLGSYFLYDWPLYYAQALSLLKELPSPPSNVLDITIGGSPCALAALQHGATTVFALGPNERALRLTADLTGHLGYPVSIRCIDPLQFRSFPEEKQWDLIILSHSLLDLLPSLEEQIPYLQKILSLLSPQGHLLLVEDSVSEINRSLLTLRDRLVELGASIAAPCLWKGMCPALKSNSLCFAQRPFDKPFLIKEIQRASHINLSSLKMSYLLLRSPAAKPPEFSSSLYRIVSPPVATFLGDRFFLCGVRGKKTLGSRLEQHPKHSKAFEYLKRGDVISIEQAAEREDDLEVTSQTKLTLFAPCDKPVPGS